MDRLRLTIYVLLAVLTVAGVSLVGCQAAPPAPASKTPAAPATTAAKPAAPAPAPATKAAGLPESIIIGTQPIGTDTYVNGVGLATVIEKYSGIKRVVTQPWPTNPQLLDATLAKRVVFTITSTGQSYLFEHGEEDYEKAGPRPIREMGLGAKSSQWWFTRPDTGIKSVKDMVGKRVAYASSVSPPNTKMYKLVLEYNGVDEKVIAVNRGSMDSAAEQLAQKKVDVIAGPIGGFVFNLQSSTGVVIIPITEAETKYINEKYPARAVVPALFKKGYYGLPEDTVTCATTKGLPTSKDQPDALIYALVKAIYDHPDDLRAIHPDTGEFNLANALAGFTVPMHPGAIKYYKEKGVWTKEHDAQQEKLLAMEKDLLAKAKK